ncbi:hypothetical protein O6H91_04G020300 [Diphasiastrum complanatum]|uniref:Uncharacterized protein n=2 Tax=Diphasiastrum complanatum TaxID=34168 RepID=A0ACC2D5Z8_DIPCM|nr:hypothetical protein O6H91_07G064800 [Diphasiastrum complanatum]KAJ7557991.1 hypothetical protein O6H91_04G020300 [Diphasiastrum complanatum]
MDMESQRESVDAFEPHRFFHLQMLVADQNVITVVSSRDWSKTRVAVEEKVSKLRDLLIQADSLRSPTLHELFSVLDPIQAAKCTIAAFELAFVEKVFIN